MERDPGRGGNTLSEDRKEILYMRMYESQPSFNDFKNREGFPNWMLKADQRKLENYLDTFDNNAASDDEEARVAEPLLTYIFRDKRVFPTRVSTSFLASDFDDKFNGTDIALGITDGNNNSSFFSIDVATGTFSENIQKKFDNGFGKYSGESPIKYCKMDDLRWSEKNAPHFILGMSPASLEKAMDKIVINGDVLVTREKDPITNFIILSEIREQISLHQALKIRKKRTEETNIFYDKLDRFLPAVFSALSNCLEIRKESYESKEEYNKAFFEKYNSLSATIMREDNTYKNIIEETKRYKNRVRAMKVS